MFERFTAEARAVVVDAQEQARDLDTDYIGTEHLLLGLLAVNDGIAYRVLRDAGLDQRRVRADIVRTIGGAEGRPLTEEDAAALRTIGIDLDAVLSRIKESFGANALRPRRRGRRRGLRSGHVPFTPRAKKVLELSLREALRLRHKHIGTEHILLGVIREGDGLAAKIMFDAGVDLEELRARILALLNRAA